MSTTTTAPVAGTAFAPTPGATGPAPGPLPRRTLVEIFDAAVVRWPARTALEGPDGSYTYTELADAAAQLAQRLHTSGIGAGDRVAVQITSGTAELYLALLGVLRAGAAYVPIDRDDPPARAADIRARSGAVACLTDGLELELLAQPRSAARAAADTAALRAAAADTAALSSAAAEISPAPEDDAWIIFTSGSTGTPKGVAVRHRNAAAFIAGEERLWQILPQDRVLAGLSVGFDASCEEIWLAWAHGAALVPAPRSVVRAGVELGNWLLERQITVVSTVPTLAALWDESCLHGVRLLILGGEACPEPLGWRLAAGREVWNTYGPTEATVVSTAAPVIPGEPVTIGWPLDGWEVAVLDGQRQVEPGEAGELVITGAGLGRYLDPTLDRERYAGVRSLHWARAYRTGDIVRVGAGGIEFVGRGDQQVKIGGRRIELGEIEAALRGAPGVRAAAVAVRESAAGNRLLVGYIVGPAGVAETRAHVARSLPSGIVPLLVSIEALPMNGAGKVDRRALPWPVGDEHEALAAGIAADGATLTPHERWVAERWIDQLGEVPIALHSDFFALGGTSLAAAKLISALRRRYPSVAVADLYRHPTLRTFAVRLETLTPAASPEVRAPAGARTRTRLVQLACLLAALFALEMPSWLAGIFAFDRYYHVGPQLAWGWIVLGWLVLATPPGRALLALALRRLLLKDLRPGRYPRNGWLSFRVQLAERVVALGHLASMADTPWAARYARLMGHAVGADARLGTLPPASALVSIGERATIEGGVDFNGWRIEGDQLIVGEVTIGAGARVGTRALLEPGCVIEAGAEVEPGSVVRGRVPAGERWAGAPARRVGIAGELWPPAAPGPGCAGDSSVGADCLAAGASGSRAGAGGSSVGGGRLPAGAGGSRAGVWQALYALGSALQSLLPLLAAGPEIALLLVAVGNVGNAGQLGLELMLLAPALAALFTLSYALLVAGALRLLGALIKPGWHAGYGLTPWALWMSDALRAQTRTALFPLYASSFTNRWLRLSGIDVGAGTEVSVTVGLNKLTRLGHKSFAVDDVAFACGRARDGRLEVAPISIGDRTFVGNGAILEAGSAIGDRSLVGVMTVAPRTIADDSTWLGAPALELPRRCACADPTRTTDPTIGLRAARRACDLVRILLPSSIAITLGSLTYTAVAWSGEHLGVLAMVLATPLALFAMGVCAVLATAAVKWLLIGRYEAGEHPFYSHYVWRDEIVNACQEQLAGAFLMNLALGTPLMGAYLRLMGAHVGRDVWVENLNTTEFDLASFGDGCAVNRAAVVHTHLFHDRVMRTGPVRIGAAATLGAESVSLPDTVIGPGAVVGGRSIVMRGEEIPAGSRWHGAPVVPE